MLRLQLLVTAKLRPKRFVCEVPLFSCPEVQCVKACLLAAWVLGWADREVGESTLRERWLLCLLIGNNGCQSTRNAMGGFLLIFVLCVCV